MKTSISIFCALVLCMFNFGVTESVGDFSNGNPPIQANFKRAAGDENQALKKMKYNWLKRVVGGKPATDNKYNFVVKVMRDSPKYPFCNGAIISSRWILTSALCLEDKKAKELSVIAGTKRTSGGIVTSKVEKLIIYDKYDTVNVIGDFALIKLSKELKLGTTEESLKAIELPEQGETVGDKCFMAAHGYTSETSLGKGLNEIDLTIVDDASCAKKMNPLWPVDKKSMFCATGDGKRTGCLLDNGAPLVCKKGDKLVARGLFSWSHLKCDPSYYSVFTRVSKFVGWIKKTMGDHA